MEPDRNYQIAIGPDKLFGMLEQKFSVQYFFSRNSFENLVIIKLDQSPLVSIYVHPHEVNIHFINPMVVDEQEQGRIYEAMDLILKR